MKQLFFFLLPLLFLAAACGDDDDLDPIFNIGRADGWQVTLVDSDFAEKADAAIAAVSEADLQAANRTREELESTYAVFVARETLVEDCDRDDILFFLENGQMRIIKEGAVCPGPGDPNVLIGFNDNFFSTNLAATELTIRDVNDVLLAEYVIEELNSEVFRLGTNRMAPDSLLGNFTYNVTYSLAARN